MKKACIISCFANFGSRTDFVEKCFVNKQYEVTHIVSDFVHGSKSKRVIDKVNAKVVSVPEYSKNFSIKRILSHREFAKGTLKIVKELSPDVIYCLIPPNFLTKYMAKYKKKNPNVKLIFDIYDVWPDDSLSKRFPLTLFPFPLRVWAGLRDKYINNCEQIITECNLYQRVLEGKLDKSKTQTVYIAKEDTGIICQAIDLSNETLNLCYLGSVNSHIDIGLICEIVKKIKSTMPVAMHIIGGGEKAKHFVSCLKEAGAEVFEYGKVFDEEKKHEIFSKCHFGINIYDEKCAIGLTLKSLCYFEAGLPIINNIKDDTYALVNKYNAGINLNDREIDVEKLLGMLQNHSELRENARKVYESEVSKLAVTKKFEIILEKVID